MYFLAHYRAGPTHNPHMAAQEGSVYPSPRWDCDCEVRLRVHRVRGGLEGHHGPNVVH